MGKHLGESNLLAVVQYYPFKDDGSQEDWAYEANFYESSEQHAGLSGHRFFMADASSGEIVKTYSDNPLITDVQKDWQVYCDKNYR